MTYEGLAKRFYAAIKVAAIACVAVKLMGCESGDGRAEARIVETIGKADWKGCKGLNQGAGGGYVGSICISVDGKTLGICDEDGCIVYQPTVTAERAP